MHSNRRSIFYLLHTFTEMNSSLSATSVADPQQQDVNRKFDAEPARPKAEPAVRPEFNVVLAAVLAGYAFEAYRKSVRLSESLNINIGVNIFTAINCKDAGILTQSQFAAEDG